MAIVSEFEFNLLDKFSSFHDLSTKLTEYKQKNFVELWIRNAKTIEATRKVAPKRCSQLKNDLK